MAEARSAAGVATDHARTPTTAAMRDEAIAVVEAIAHGSRCDC